jgi:cellulose biosynthesis protein BcsQ
VSISFATAVSSHEREDKLIAALTSQGFRLSFRAITPSQLEDFLLVLDHNERILIVFDEEFQNVVRAVKKSRESQLGFFFLESGLTWSEQELVQAALEALRQPAIVKTQPLRKKARLDWIGVLGTSGSPGISSVAINIAAEISQKTPTRIVDADNQNQDLHILLGTRREGTSALTSSLSLMSITSDDDRLALEEDRSRITVIDIGETPPLHSEIFTDRRLKVRSTIDLMMQAHQLIYVAQPENRALRELDTFLEFAEQEMSHLQLTFLLNKMGNSTRHKGILRSLKKRVADRPLFIVPRDYALFDRSQARFATLGEVGARTSARRAISELSIYLSKSI